MKIRNTTITIKKGDITKLKADAIVTPANGSLTMDKGLAGILKKKGGEVIEKEALKKSPVNPGLAVYTKAGKLKAKYVIHSVTVDGNAKTDEIILRHACANALKAAQELKCQSIVFPALGCGVGGFSPSGASKILAQEIMKYLRADKVSLKEITICLKDTETFEIFDKNVRVYIEYMLHKQQQGPYVTVDVIIELSASATNKENEKRRDLAILPEADGGPEGIILIERSNPPFGWALPGGFVDYGESLEAAAIRETKEETNMDLENVRQFHSYSDPRRDPRFHTIATVFIAKGVGKPQFGDDAKGLKVVKYEDLLKLEYAFDHKKIIADYLKQR